MNCGVTVAVLLAATVSISASVPDPARNEGRYQCAGYCKGSSKFKYVPDTTYVYDYRAHTSTSIRGAMEEKSQLHLSATAYFHVVSQCDFILQLENVQIADSDLTDVDSRNSVERSAQFSSALEKNSLRFSFQDGTVDELCADDDDPVWVLNIKRGILSAFQNTMHDLSSAREKHHETDVTGTCETNYDVILEEDEFNNPLLRVGKMKNLLACSHRMDHFLSLQSTPYMSSAQSLPLIKSQQRGSQVIADSILKKSTNNEIHTFRPFSKHESGAVTVVNQILTFQTSHTKEIPHNSGSAPLRRTTLLYENTDSTDKKINLEDTAKEVLQNLVNKTYHGVESDVPSIFSHLVATLNSMNYTELSNVFNYFTGKLPRKFFLDAMPHVTTADGAALMTSLFKSNDITSEQMDSWLSSLAFQKKPTLATISSVSSLLDGTPSEKGLLGISALVHSYCQRNKNCFEIEQIKEIMMKMEDFLGSSCEPSDKITLKLIILSLKAIGNAGIFTGSTDTLRKCFQNKNPIEVRLAAISAYRRLPCSEHTRSHLLDLYTDKRQDTELRIAAYLAVMQCPSSHIIRRIINTLYTEDVNQVASFVWTHLTNLQETSSHWKQNVRALVSNDFLRNKFKTDVRKFSRNYEGSFFSEALNAGAAAESNVIFTPQSYLPRSATLNLTLDLFGESVNILEVGARAQGFESIVESMFGPEGYFPDNAVNQMLKKLRDKNEEDSVENSITKLADEFDARGKLGKEPSASLYTRVFGNELQYAQFHGFEEVISSLSDVTTFDVVRRITQQKDIDFAKSIVIIDGSYMIPTCIGLPMNLALNGSATVGFKLQGHANIKDLFTLNSIDIEGSVAPSAAVEFAGTMAVDATITKAGVRLVNTLHTNTYIDGKINIQGGEIVDLKLNVPHKKTELLNIKSQLYVLHRDHLIESKGIKENIENYKLCSTDFINSLTGMKSCMELIYVNSSLHPHAPYFPLTGPFKFLLDVTKVDTFNAYELIFKHHKGVSKRGNSTSMSFHFDTPGSKVDRKLSAQYVLDWSNSAAKASILTPFIKIAGSAKTENSDNFKLLDTTLLLNNQELFATRLGLKKIQNGHNGRYEPFFALSYKKKLIADITGKVNYAEGFKYSADLVIKGLSKEQITISGDLNMNEDKYDLMGNIKSKPLSSTIHGSLRFTDSSLSTKVTVQYKIGKSELHTLGFSAKLQDNSKGTLTRNNMHLTLQMTQFPHYNVDASWDLQHSDYYFDSSGRLTVGDRIWQTQQLYKFQSTEDILNFAVMCTLKCPKLGVDYGVGVQNQVTNATLSSLFMLTITPQFKLSTNVDYSHELRNELHQHMLTANLTSPWCNTGLNGTLTETAPGRHEIQLASGSGANKLHLNGVYSDGSNKVKVEHHLNLTLAGPLNGKFSAGLVFSTNTKSQWIQLDINNKTYVANVTYIKDIFHFLEVTMRLAESTYGGSVVLLSTSVEKGFAIDLKLRKRINMATKITCDGKKHGLQFELFWDKDANPNKKISLVAQAEGNKKEVLLEIPGRYLKGEVVTVAGGATGYLEWAEHRKISAQLEWNLDEGKADFTAKISTPFPRMESLYLFATYTLMENEGVFLVDTSWQKEKLSLTFDVKRINNNSDFWGLKAGMHIESTVPEIGLISFDLDHYSRKNNQRTIKTTAILKYNSQHSTFEANWKSDKSSLFGDIKLNSPFRCLEFLKHTLKFTDNPIETSGSLEMNWARDSKIIADFVIKKADGAAGVFRIVTPFIGYELTSAEYNFTKFRSSDGSFHVIMEAVTVFKDYLAMFDISGYKSKTSLAGTLQFKTPFTDDFRAHALHQFDKGKLNETFLLSLAEHQLLHVYLEGEVHSFPNTQLSAGVKIPNQNVYVALKNYLHPESLEFNCQGKWNDNNITISALGKYVNSDDVLSINFDMTANSTILPRGVRLSFDHICSAGTLQTSLLLPSDIKIENLFSINDSLNWENKLNFQTPRKIGSIVNKQHFKDGLTLEHEMIANLNGEQASGIVTFVRDEQSVTIKEAKAIVMTPWTDPVTILYKLPMDTSDIRPSVVLQFRRNKEIRIEAQIQYQLLQSRLDMQIVSPFHKPVLVNASYNLEKTNFTGLILIQWEGKKCNVKSHMQFEHNLMKTSGDFSITHSDQATDIASGSFSYNLIDPEVTAHALGVYKDQKLGFGLSLLLGKRVYKGSLTVQTPFQNWENLSLSGQINLVKPTKLAVMTFSKNLEDITVSGLFSSDANSSKFSVALTSHIPSFPSVSVYGSYDISSSNSHIFELNYDSQGKKIEFLAKIQLDDDSFINSLLAESTLKTPFVGYETLTAHCSYNIRENEKRFDLKLIKSSWKFTIESKCVFSPGEGTGELNIELPFEDLTEMSLSVRYALRPSSQERTLSIFMSRNEVAVEMKGALLVSPGGSLTAGVEIKSPIEGYKNIACNLALSASPGQRKSITLMFSKDEEQYMMTGTFEKNREARLTITTPLKGYHIIDAKIGYVISKEDTLNSNIKRRVYASLDMPIGKSEISIELDLRKVNSIISGTIVSPLLMIPHFEMKGQYDVRSFPASFSFIVNKDMINFMGLQVTLEQNRLVGEITTPFQRYQNIGLSGSIRSKENNKMTHLKLKIGEDSFELFSTVALGTTTSDIRAELITTKPGFERLVLHGQYDLSQNDKTAEVTISLDSMSTYELFITGAADSKVGQLKIQAFTPLSDYQNIVLTARYDLTQDYYANFVLEKNGSKSNFGGHVVLSDDGTVLRIETPFQHIKDISLYSTYQTGDDESSARLTVTKDGILTVLDTSFELSNNIAVIKISTSFESVRELIITTDLSGISMSGKESTISVSVLKNSEYFLRASSYINVDWNREVNALLKLDTPLLPNLSLSLSFVPSFSPSKIKLMVTKNAEKIFIFRNEFDTKPSGFSYNFELTSLLREKEQCLFNVDYSPSENYMMFNIDMLTAGQQKQYVGDIRINKNNNELSAILKTPITGYENFSLRWKHSYNFIRGELITPLKGYENHTLAAHYEIQSKEKSVTFLISTTENLISFRANLEHINDGKELNIHIITPFSAFKKLDFHILYVKSNTKNKMGLTINLNDRYFKMNGESDIKKNRLEAMLAVSSFLPALNNMKVKIFYDLSESLALGSVLDIGNMSLNATGTIDFDLLQGEILGYLKKYGRTIERKISWSLENYAVMKSAKIAVNLTEELNFAVHAKLELNSVDNIEFQVAYNQSENIYPLTSSTFKIEWNVRNITNFNAGLHVVVNNEVICEININADLNNSVEFKYSGVLIYFTYCKFHTIYRAINNSHIELSSQLNFGYSEEATGLLHFSLTPYTANFSTQWSEMYFSVGYDLTTNYKILDFKYRRGSNTYGLSTNLTLNKSAFPLASITLQTPIKNYYFLRVNNQYITNSTHKGFKILIQREEINGEVSLILWKSKHSTGIKSNISLPIGNMNTWYGTVNFEATSGLEGNVNCSWDSTKYSSVYFKYVPGSLVASVSTPFTGLVDLKTEYLMEKSLMAKVNFSVNYGEKKILFYGTYDFSKENKPEVNVIFNSPWTKSFILSGKYDNSETPKFIVILQRENKVTVLDAQFRYDMENAEFKIDVSSTIEAHMEYSVKNREAYFEAETADFSLIFGGRLVEDEFTGILHVRTPFDCFKEIMAEVRIDISRSAIVKVRCNDKTYALQGELKHTEGKFNGQFSLITPYINFNGVEFEIKYDSESAYINVGSPGEALYMGCSYKFGGRSYFVRAMLKVPSVELLNHVSFATSLDAENLTALVMGQWSANKVMVISAKLIQSNLSIILETPFLGIERIVATSSFKNDKTQLLLVGRVEVGNDGEKFHVQLIIGNGRVQYSFYIETFAGLNYNLTLQYKDKKYMSAKFILGDKNTENFFVTEGVLNVEEMSLKLKFNHSYFINAEYEGRLTYASWRNAKVTLQNTLDGNTHSAEGSYIISDKGIVVKWNEKAPDSESSSVLGATYEYDNKNEMKAALYFNDDILSVSYKFNETSLIASFKLDSENILKIKDTSLEFKGTYIHVLYGLFAYKYEDYSGNLEIALGKTNDTLFARGTIDMEQFLGPLNHTAEIIYNTKDQHGVVKFLYEGKTKHVINVIYEFEDKIFEITVDVNSKILGKQKILLLLKNDWKTAHFEIMNVLSISLRLKQHEGSLTVTSPGMQHEISYHLSNDKGYYGHLELVTPFVANGKVNMTVITKNDVKRKYIELKCISGAAIHRFALELNDGVEKKTITMQILGSSKSVLNLDASLKLDGGTIQANASLDLLGVASSAELRHTWAMPLNSELKVMSPYLPNNVLQIVLNTENDSLTLFGGFGGKQFGQYIMLEGALNRSEGTAYLNLKSPMLSLVHSAGINGIYRVDEGSLYNIGFSCYFSSESVSNSELSAGFQLSSQGIDTAVKFLPPWKDSDNYGATISIPFILSNDMKPRLALNLGNNNTYSVHGTFVNLENIQEVGFGAQYRLRKLGGSLTIENNPVTRLQAEIDLPLGDNKGHYGINIKTQKGQNLLAVENALNYTHIGIQWDDKEIEFRYSLSYVETTEEIAVSNDTVLKCTLILQLTTPFRGYEQNILKMHVNLSPSQSLIISSVKYPGYSKPFGFELNYHLKSYNDVSFVSQLHIPFISALEDVALVFSSKYEEKQGEFRSVLGGHWNKEELAITLEGSLAAEFVLKGSVTLKLVGQPYALHFNYGSSNRNLMGPFVIKVQLTSPIKVLKNAEMYVEVDLMKSVLASLTHNSEELLGFRVYSDEVTLFAVEVRNPWRSAYFMFGYDISKDIMIQAELSWDINGMNKSQVGVIFALANGPYNRNDLSATLKLPTRVLVLNCTRWLSPANIEYSGSFSWKKGQVIGFKTVTKMNSSSEGFMLSALSRIDLPFRSFEVETHTSARLDVGALKYADVGVEFLWDALGNRNKRIGIELRHYSPTVEIVLRHAALENDFVVRIEKNGKLAYDNLPFTIKMEIEYSPLPEDLITLETHVQNPTDASSGLNVGFTLRHIPTSIDFRISAEIIQTSRDCSGQIRAEYLNSYTRQKHNLEILGKISSKHPEFQVAVKTAENRLEAHGLLQSSDMSSYGAFLEFHMNQKEPLSVAASINIAEPRAELEAHYGNSRSYKIYAGVPHSREIMFNMKHVMYGMEYEDAAVILRLNTSQQLWSRIKWQPRALSDLKTGLLQEYSDINHVIQSIGSGFSDVWLKDVAYKCNIIYPMLTDAIENIGSTSMTEIGAIYKDVLNVGEEMTAMYWRNDFYLRDMQPYFNKTISYIKEKASGICQLLLDGVESVFLSIKDFVALIVNSLQIDFSRVFHILHDFKVVADKAVTYVVNFIEEAKRMHAASKQYLKSRIEAIRSELAHVEQNMKKFLVFVENYLIDLVTKYINLLEPYLTKIENTMELLSRRVIDFEDKISEYILDMVQTLVGAEEVQDLIALYNKYASWLEELHLQEYVDQLTKLLQSIQKLVMHDIQRVCADYLDYINYVTNTVNDIYKHINAMPLIAYTRHAANLVYEKARWMWEHYELSNHIKNQIHSWIENLDKLLLRLLNAIDMDASSPTKSLTPSITLRPDIGLVEYSQKLPIDWHGFNELPKFEQLQLYEQAKDHANEIASLDKYRYYLMDTLYDMTNNISMTSVLPPFSAYGIVAGRKHYITFDKKFYDFTGECSYLLASDFLNNKFSAFVTYEIKNREAVKKSLTVLIEGYRIEINPNKQVTVDGQKVEMPVEVNSQTWIKIIGERVVIHSELGVEVDCNLYHDICTVELSGWYFGKTGGLLGTFDYEPTNDLSLPNGTNTQSVETFADSWHVGSARCYSTNHALTSTQHDAETKSSSDSNQCTEYFEEPLSPLRPCFSRVETDPFYKMCLSELADNKTDGVCLSVAAYVSQCKKAGVDIMMPHNCVRCLSSNGNTMKAGQLEVFHGVNVKTADIVFVVEQSPCIKKMNLAELLLKLDSAMNHQSLDTRFSVVGFGGNKFSEPHTRTSNGKIWSSLKGAEKTLRSLQIATSDITNTESLSAFGALWFASHLPFRIAASKTIVLVQCASCQDTGDDYSAMINTLLENDITLHILQPHALKLRSGRDKMSKVYGVDLNGAFSGRNLKSLMPSFPLLRQIALPKDMCTPLAFETNGTLFNIDRLMQGGKNTRRASAKKFIDVWARRVTLSAKPSPCQKCECVTNDNGVGQIMCSKCLSPSIEHFLKQWESLKISDHKEPHGSTDYTDYPA